MMPCPMRKSSRVAKRKVYHDYEYDLTRKKATSPPESHQVSMQKPQSKIKNKKSCEPLVKKPSIKNTKISYHRENQICNENGKAVKDYGQNLTFKTSERKSLQKKSHANLNAVIEQSFENQPHSGSRSNLGQKANTSVSSGYACHETEDIPSGNASSSVTHNKKHSDMNMEEVTIETHNSEGCEDAAKTLSPFKKLLVTQLQLSPVLPAQTQMESKRIQKSKEAPIALASSISKSSDNPQNSSGRLTRERKSKIIAQLSYNSDMDPSASSGDEYKPVKRSGRYLQSKKYSKKIKLPQEKEDSKIKWTHSPEGLCCSFCGKHFKSLKLVSFHETSHTGVKPFSCSFCGQKFGLKSNMQHHEQLHSEDKPYMCEVCGKCFKTSAYCKSHAQVHRTEKLFKCESPNCGKSFSTRRYHHIHQLCHRNVKPFKCRHCGKFFRRRSDLNIHSSIHSHTKMFRCDVCQKRFSHKYALNAHSILHKKRPFNCGHCRRFFETEADKNVHEAFHYRHPSLECEVCNLENIGLRQLGTHLRKVHDIETANIKCFSCHLTFPTQFSYEQHCSSKTSLSCPFCYKVLTSYCEVFVHRKEHKGKESGLNDKICNVCDFCGKEFRRLSSLTKHKLIHETGKLTCEICGKETMNKHNLKVHIETHSKEKSFSCVTCGKCFSTKIVLEQHVLIHTGEKPFSCAVCHKAFRTKAMMKEHARIHGERNFFKCELCGKEYASRTNYKNHLNVHKGNRNFECEVCGKTFFAKYVMRKHMQIHTGTKNYQCEYCGKKFIQHGNWLIHRRSHTGEKPHGCAQCPAAFVNSSQLKAHEKRVHHQKKEFMCDKCYKHFYTRKGLQGHMRNIHQKKEKGQIYHCGKCDRLFALQENQQEHESSCIGLGRVLPSLRPSVLQTVLRKVYSHEARKVSKRLETKNAIDRPSEVVIEPKRNLIQEPVQLIPVDAMDQQIPVPAPVQQFQVTSEAQEPLIESVDVNQVVHILTPDSSYPCETVESYVELEEVPNEEGEESPKDISGRSITDVQPFVKISSFIGKTASGAASHLITDDTPQSQLGIDAGSQIRTTVSSSGDSVQTGNNALSMLIKEKYLESADLAKIIETCKLGFDSCIKSSGIKEEPCSVRSSAGDCSGSCKNIQKPKLSEQAKTTDPLETSKLQASSCNQSGTALTLNNDESSSQNSSYSRKFSCDTSFNNECIDTEFQCRLCHTPFKSEIEARKHLEAHSNQLLYQCSICSQRFASNESLNSHLLTHIFSCISGKETQISNNVSSHVKALQPTNIVSSRNEYELSSNISNLNREAIQFSNNISSKRYESPNSIIELSTSKCGDENSNMETSTKISPKVDKECCTSEYSCKDCRREFSSRGRLKLHQYYHNCRRQVKFGVVTRGRYLYLHQEQPFLKVHLCQVCKKTLRSLSVFQIHKRTHDCNSFQCSQCQKKFVFLKNFKKHKLGHSNKSDRSSASSSVIPIAQTEESSANAVPNQESVSGCQKISSEPSNLFDQPVSSVHPRSCHQQVLDASDDEPTLIIQPGSSQNVQQIQPDSGNQSFSKSSNIQSVQSIQTKKSKLLTSQTDNSRTIVQLSSGQSTSSIQSTKVQPTTGCQLTSSCFQPLDVFRVNAPKIYSYSCSLCEETFPFQELLSAHYNTHVFPDVKFLCQICKLHFDEETQFTDHIKLHGDVVLEVGQK